MEMNTVQPTASSTILVQGRNSYLFQHEVPGMPNIVNINTTANDTTATAGVANLTNTNVQKSLNSAPSSPYYSNASNETRPPTGLTTAAGINGTGQGSAQCPPNTTTPKKHQLRKIRELLLSPGGCDWQALRLEVESVDVIKDRYLISSMPNSISAAAATKTPISYRHLIDLSSARLKCTDVFTEEHFLCKIINEPLHKVQLAYFQLQRDSEGCRSVLYGHNLIRAVRDIVPMSKSRTYMIIPATVTSNDISTGAAPDAAERVFEDLHTYVRNKKFLSESEARPLFHQICQTVQVCHRNGIILRDLKLKRFYFIDEARTKLQYESLEGSMILDNPEDDTLSDKIGCPLYTAPELLCPNPTYNGKPADMWSLGVILYTMLVGRYPFYEKGNCSLIRIIRHVNVSIPSSISRPARWLLLNLLRKNYEERLRADCIFLVPWLRQQRTLFVPVDVIIPDDNSDDDGSDNEQMMDIESLKPLDYSCTDLQRFMVSNSDLTQLSADQHQEHDGNERLHSINSNVGMG